MVFQEPMTSLNPSMTIGRQLDEGLALHRDLDARRAPQAGSRHAHARRDPRSRRRADRLSAPVLRRHAPAHHAGLGDAAEAGAADRRRADHGARCRGSARRAGTDGRADAGAWHRRADDQPRPVDGRPLHRPHHRDVQGRDRRGGRNPGSPASAEASLHPQTARRDAAPSSTAARSGYGNADRRCSQPGGRIQGPAGLLPQGSRRSARFMASIFRSSRGEVVALVGGSGSGKTTLGRAIAGLLQPTGGEILFAAARSFPAARAGPIIASTARWSSRTRIPRSIRA